MKVLGKNPTGAHLARIKQSANYRNGSFQNISPTEVTLKEASFLKMMQGFVNKPKTTVPATNLPTVKTDLKMLQAPKPTIIWFGHSSYLIKYQNLTILIDPVFSNNASPVSYFGKAFPGTNLFTPAEFPSIDILLLTHDHYDHLDYKTILQLKDKVKHIYAPLGVGSHLEYWGVAIEKITELDWWESLPIGDNIQLTATPARHFSGRSVKRNATLWTSYIVQLDAYKLFLGGDSGYDTHFAEIGEKYGPFDIALLETGQYNEMWPYIHMMPEEAVQAAQDLRAQVLLPVHWGKFALAYHAWTEPVERVLKAAAQFNIMVTTPQIGELVVINEHYPRQAWWKL